MMTVSGGSEDLKDLFLRVETLELIGPYMALRGWVYHLTQAVTQVSFRFQGAGYDDSINGLIGLLRADVAATYGTESAAYSGFRADGLLCLTSGVLFADISMAGVAAKLSVALGDILPRRIDGGWSFVQRPRCGDVDLSGDRIVAVNAVGKMPPSMNAARTLAALQWDTKQERYRARRPVTLLTSVYKGEEFLEDFFRTVAADADAYDEFVVVDDGNTDLALLRKLNSLVDATPKARLVSAEKNMGYLAAISTAFRNRRFDGHVVLLNTDIVLPPNWLGRLIRPLEEFPRVACTTPFTNAGTVASFPFMPMDNNIFLGLTVTEIDAAFQSVMPAAFLPDLPTGIGFCMAMHADCLAELGLFELETFGFGYCEENDWCLKAWIRGWRSVLVPNLFVYHKHGGSFPSEQKRALIDRNLHIIRERYPFYPAWVEDHIAEDPAAGLRHALAYHLAKGNQPKTEYATLILDEVGAIDTLLTAQVWILIVQSPTDPSWTMILAAGGTRWCLWGWGDAEREMVLTRLQTADDRANAA